MSKFTVSAFLCAGMVAAGISAPANASVVYDLTLTAISDFRRHASFNI